MFSDRILNLKSRKNFDDLCLEVFNFQALNNPVYAEYLKHLKIEPEHVQSVDAIPFLPIRFFKSRQVICSGQSAEIVFTSSGTGHTGQSRHWVSRLDVYEMSFRKAFRMFFGSPDEYVILALLPGYLERKGSSLIYMVNDLINHGGSELSGFFSDDFDKLDAHIRRAAGTSRKLMLWGVSFGLLDFFEKFLCHNPEMLIVETGGMKGRRKEIIRDELHARLRDASGTKKIYSEYGMTELLSQAYMLSGENFKSPPWMEVRIRDLYDPFAKAPKGTTGGINVIDLANFNSCAFIETEDLGKHYADGSFEVLGRYDHSEIRGCNLMVD